MASVEVEVADRKYVVACRDGEEDHLRTLAVHVDQRARDAAAALGGLTETRQLLFAALLIADDLKEARSGRPEAQPIDPPAASAIDPALVETLERLAERTERLAERLESEQSGA